jgi:hypothetical protein
MRSPAASQGDITLRRKKRFLDAFARCGVLTYAARAAGISRVTVYAWQEHDPEFAAALREAAIESTEALEREAYRRAHGGVLQSVYQQGQRVGQVRKYSDVLLIFLLKARKPEVYRDVIDARGTLAPGDAAAAAALEPSDSERAAFRAFLRSRPRGGGDDVLDPGDPGDGGPERPALGSGEP